MRLHWLLVRLLLPERFRREYGRELRYDFELRAGSARYSGARGRLLLWTRELADLSRAAVRERPPAVAETLRAVVLDVTLGARSLRRRRGLALGASGVVALGIGVATAGYAALDAVLLEPLPYPEPHELVVVYNHGVFEGGSRWLVEHSREQLREFESSIDAFEAVGAFTAGRADLIGAVEPSSVMRVRASPPLLEMLGARPAIGRLFGGDDRATDVALLPRGAWQSRWGGAEDVIGRRLRLGVDSYTIIGVLDDDFAVQGLDAEVITPLPADGEGEFRVLARLAQGVPVDVAREELRAFYRSRDGIVGDSRSPDPAYRFPLISLHAREVHRVRSSVLALTGATGLVLLIAYANATSLLLVSALRRREELATRMALGAGRLRIARMLLAEGVAVAVAGGGVGVLVGDLLLRVIVSQQPGGIPRLDQVRLDPEAVAFAFAISLAVGVAAGLVTVWGSVRGERTSGLAGRDAGGSRRAARLRASLIAAEVALAVVLLAGAGLLVRTLLELHEVELGFDGSNLLVLELRLSSDTYPEPAEQHAFLAELEREMLSRNAVEAFAVGSAVPLGRSRGAVWVDFFPDDVPPGFDGSSPPDFPGFGTREGEYTANSVTVSRSYFDALDMPLLWGRLAEPAAPDAEEREVVISERMAENLWGGRQAIGEAFRLFDRRLTVVGIVRDVRFGDVRIDYLPTIYFPLERQRLDRTLHVMLTTRGQPGDFAAEARQAVWTVDPVLPIRSLATMDELRGRWIAEPRFYSLLIGWLALSAMVLAATGLYAVLSHAIRQRTREIGIRMALGATRRGVVGLVVRQGLATAAIGLVAGALVAGWFTQWLEGLLFRVSPGDPGNMLGAVLLLVAVALAAVARPAARAAGLDPKVALRAE